MEYIVALKETPLPTLLVGGGLLFVFLSLVTLRRPIVIDLTPSSRKVLGRIGGIVLVVGIILYLVPVLPFPPLTTAEGNIEPPLRITDVSQLPKEGELIIPKGYLIEIPDGMVGTTWYFTSSDTENKILEFANSVASDRAKQYGGRAKDYPVVIWIDTQLPASTSQCPNVLEKQSGVGAPGTRVGDQSCFHMLEYRLAK